MSELSKEYGWGLFAAASAIGVDADILHESRALSEFITADYVKLLSNPAIPKNERLTLVGELLDGRVHPYLSNFVKLMVSRSLAYEIRDSFMEYEKIYYEHHCIVKVRAESAVPLTDAQKEKLYTNLRARTGRELEIEYVVDPLLVGGMRLSLDNRQIDGTLKSRIRNIALKLSETVI